MCYLCHVTCHTRFGLFISIQIYTTFYCAFHKHANSKVQKPTSQLRFSLPSIIITITSNEHWNTETHKTNRNPPITNQKPWPFEPVKVKFCFLRGPLRWLTAAKNTIVSWLLNFRICMFMKSAVIHSNSHTSGLVYAGFTTCLVRCVRVRYMFATNMPNLLPLLIHCFNSNRTELKHGAHFRLRKADLFKTRCSF